MSGSNIADSVSKDAPVVVMPLPPTTRVTLATGYNTVDEKLTGHSRPRGQSHSSTTIPRVKRKGNSSLNNTASWPLDTQIAISFNLVALLFLTHLCVPKARYYTSRFFLTSYYNANTGKYAAGGDDFYFLGLCVVLFTGARASFMKYFLAPLARRWGISKRKDIARFSEQSWLLCYYSVFWTLGLHIYCTSTYFLNLREMFTDWPTRELSHVTKAYILGQWAFWLQQIIVINIEERRKDHWQMLAHHIITVMLISASYGLHLTRVANLILVLMDVVDIFFPLAKCLKYLGFSTLRDIMFGFFMLSWFVARHVFYIITMWSIWSHMAEIIPIGCYHGSQNDLIGPTPLPDHGFLHMLEPFRKPAGTICYSDSIRWGFLGALGFLQALTIVWFFMIVQVAIRVIKGIGADDIRSEDEGDDQEEDDDKGHRDCHRASHPIEVRVEASDLHLRKPRISGKRTASSSGVSLTRGGDRKELLNRIGCERQVD
ncbi:Sphingosine N-acyltransferase [Purpureocillium takamizusanense]|uniref:Sphingosine N-acyltransferase n=1 Tax=Purpureocillium takamizusanense TaxID=2060973 RepID=A0A9Q8QCT2_9HYPO|nr:Sphingosine N-acyltransferase [Purpureocillium takamizusanense]UNI16619.1 Sphingosine N-acyltransferase [Purpureocillium takamizusanense]